MTKHFTKPHQPNGLLLQLFRAKSTQRTKTVNVSPTTPAKLQLPSGAAVTAAAL
jgi:hypothetical protein